MHISYPSGEVQGAFRGGGGVALGRGWRPGLGSSGFQGGVPAVREELVGVDAVAFGALDKREVDGGRAWFTDASLVSNPINVPVVLEKRCVMRFCDLDAVPHPSRNLKYGHALLYQHAAE